ncbi:MAG: hypothetical protein HC806_00925 [Anaerolineae bacterium]|nr:hypothetical protein [Anaerolineae bacterium]
MLIATGAEARMARFPGSDLPGVVKLDDVSDARHIHQTGKIIASGQLWWGVGLPP